MTFGHNEMSRLEAAKMATNLSEISPIGNDTESFNYLTQCAEVNHQTQLDRSVQERGI